MVYSVGAISELIRLRVLLVPRKSPTPGHSLAEKRPDLAKEWSQENEFSPWEVYSSTATKYWWTCKKHGEYLSSCNSRSSGTGCPKCGKIKAGRNRATPEYKTSFGFIYPDKVELWSSRNNKTPFEVYPSSNTKYWFVCPIHGEYQTRVEHVSSGHMCNKCSSIKAGESHSIPIKEKSLAGLYPSLIPEWSKENDKSPYEVYPGSGYRAKWICKKGHEWSGVCFDRTRKDSPTGCPRCACVGMSNIERNLHDLLIPYGADKSENISIGHWKVDIYFPDNNTIVEYDGSRFHSFPKSEEKDTKKSLDLLLQGHKVIRVREISDRFILKSLSIINPSYYEIFYENGYNNRYSSEPSMELVEEVIKCLT